MTLSPLSSVLQLFWHNVTSRPDSAFLTWVDDNGADAEALTYRAMHADASSIGAMLQAQGIGRGDRVVLVYPPSLHFIRAMVGCMSTGIIPIPVYPPSPLNPGKELATLRAIVANSGARAILTTGEFLSARERGAQRKGATHQWPTLPWLATDEAPASDALPEPITPRAEDVAFIQYTSGSTSEPKGVVITHGNVAHQMAALREGVKLGADSRSVLWLPQYHDLGLVSGIMLAVAGCGHLHLMSPQAFVQRPSLWFDVASRVKATHTAAPNFAYELLLRRTTPEQRAAWDLRSLEVMLSAAEPIRAETMDAFMDAFSTSGLRQDAFFPAYGLAEHTVGVSAGGGARIRVERARLEGEGTVRLSDKREGSEVSTLVGCGVPLPGVRVRVVDPESCMTVADDRIGEIWVDSPSTAHGYWKMPDVSHETFGARLKGQEDDGTWLRTGDLGFMHGGEVVITGRRKDLIIIRGRNLYPQDVEASVRECHPLLRGGSVAAFSVPAGKGHDVERLVVVAEARAMKLQPADADAIVAMIRQRVVQDHQQAVDSVVIGRIGTVLRTTSGKIRRRTLQQMFVRGELASASTTLHTTESSAPRDPRLADVDDGFMRIARELARAFTRMTRERNGRVVHNFATTLRGELEVLPGLPAHRFLVAGARLPVLVRHSNGVADDDAAVDNRGASMRIGGVWDLLLTTGECFTSPSAQHFLRWMAGGLESREEQARREPHLRAAAWGMYRRADSYAALHYHSKTASHFIAVDGTRHWARFRIIPAERTLDAGHIRPDTRTLPPEGMPRDPSDTRPQHFLHDELRTRLANGGVRYLLQAQLRAQGDSDDDALDCTRPWPEALTPWTDVAAIHLDAVDEQGDALDFNPINAPPDLAMPLARSASEPASLAHMRSLVYELASLTRRGAPIPAGLASLMDAPARKAEDPTPSTAPRAQRLKVCVVGAGASGLTAAHELQSLGHEVTVLERASSVGGKAASLELGGRHYDWGGHLCSEHYRTVASLVEELKLETEPVTPPIVYDLEERWVVPQSRERTAAMREAFLRYAAERAAHFPDIREPGLHRAAKALGVPVSTWLRAHRLEALGDAIQIGYTSSGYGFLDDPELSALYVMKMVETAGFDGASGSQRFWTIKGGFARLWGALADGLKDLRLGSPPLSVQRKDGKVEVCTAAGIETFDRLVVAVPPAQALRFLDVDAEEAELLGRVRTLDYYTTVVSAEGLPELGFYLLKQHCQRMDTIGHSVAFHHRYEGSDVYLFYSFGKPGMGGADITRLVEEDIIRMGGKLRKVHAQRRWDYFPHASVQDVAQGFHERLEARQGERNTFFLGSVFNFELIECNTSYARALMRQHLAIAAPAEQAAPVVTAARGLLKEVAEGQRVTHVLEVIQRLLRESGLCRNVPSPDVEFASLGLDSLAAVELAHRLERELGVRLAAVAMFDHPTPRALAEHLATEAAPSSAGATASSGPWQQVQDVVFSELDGMARTMDVFTPTGPSNGLAVVDVVSEQWRSGRDVLLSHRVQGVFDALCAKGFTVFAVRPGSLPRVDGHEMVGAVHEAIRFVKSRAAAYGIDPLRVGLTGISAGAGLAATAFLTSEGGDPARDGSAAAGLLFATVTDLAHHRSLDGYASLVGGATREESQSRERALSALHQVGSPVGALRLLHAERDPLVPFSSVQLFSSALRDAGCSVELVARAADRHLWQDMDRDFVDGAAWLEEALRRPAPARRNTQKEVVRQLASRWTSRRQGQLGGLATYALAFAARAARKDDPTTPRFAAALDALRSLQRADGCVGQVSTHPYSGMCVQLAFANTLQRWNTDGRSDDAIRNALRYAMREWSRLQHPPYVNDDGKDRHADAFLLGGYLMLARECESLLTHGARFVDEKLGAAVLEVLARRDALRPRHAERRGTLQFFMCEEDGDAGTLDAMHRAMMRDDDTQLPSMSTLENAFMLMYLARAGVDVRKTCPQSVSVVLSQLDAEGVRQTVTSELPDCDVSAVAQVACHLAGLPTQMETEGLDRFWRPEQNRYLFADNTGTYCPSVALHVLDAYLTSGDVPARRVREIFERVLAQLDGWPPLDAFNISPLYVLEKMAVVVGEGARRFPDVDTRVHLDAIEQVLAMQDADTGGFRSAFVQGPNAEETALALMALKSAHGWAISDELRARIAAAIVAGQFFLTRQVDRHLADQPIAIPELWTGRLMTAPVNLVEAVMLAGLSKPIAEAARASRRAEQAPALVLEA